jgi:hypothetical protein
MSNIEGLACGPEPFEIYFDRSGARITFAEWQQLRRDPDYVEVASSAGPGWLVRTTWEGVLHDRLDDPLPFRVTASDGQCVDCVDETIARQMHLAEVARLHAIKE